MMCSGIAVLSVVIMRICSLLTGVTGLEGVGLAFGAFFLATWAQEFWRAAGGGGGGAGSPSGCLPVAAGGGGGGRS